MQSTCFIKLLPIGINFRNHRDCIIRPFCLLQHHITTYCNQVSFLSRTDFDFIRSHEDDVSCLHKFYFLLQFAYCMKYAPETSGAISLPVSSMRVGSIWELFSGPVGIRHLDQQIQPNFHDWLSDVLAFINHLRYRSASTILGGTISFKASRSAQSHPH